MNDHVNPIIARALAPFTPPEPSMVIDCPACYGGWRDTPTGVVMCGQCMGTGRRATNQGEP